MSKTEKYTRYYLPNVEIKDYNVMIDGKNFFDRPVKIDIRTYDNVPKLHPVKEIQLVVCWIIITSMNTIKSYRYKK